jgi:hypothetical protein
MSSGTRAAQRWAYVLVIGATCGFLGLLSVAFRTPNRPSRPSLVPHPPATTTGAIGRTFDVDGVRVTLERVIDPAHASIDYTFPHPGMRFVALVFDLTNTAGTPSTDSPYQLVSAVDQQSTVRFPDFTRVAECPQNFNTGTITLGPFEEQRGCVTIQVPLGLQPVSVRYASPDPSAPNVQWNLGRG